MPVRKPPIYCYKIHGTKIPNSLRFRSAGSTTLSRVAGVPTSATIWTLSLWLKRGTLGTLQEIYVGETNTTNRYRIQFSTGNLLQLTLGTTTVNSSTSIFRDTTSWYHIVVKSDGANVYAYVNNVLSVTYTGNMTGINESGKTQYFGTLGSAGTDYFDGYLADIYFIDGQALNPSFFAETNRNNSWVPKKYNGTYGNNGFYLPFSDNTSTTTIGYDKSGGTNNWTSSGHSLTVGSTYDWFIDSPSNNFATINPNLMYSNDTFNGNIEGTALATYRNVSSSFAFDAATQNVFWEVVPTAGASTGNIGAAKTTRLTDPNWNTDVRQPANTTDLFNYRFDGQFEYNGTETTGYTTYTLNDIIGFAVLNGNLYIYKNGTVINSGNPMITGMTGLWYPTGWNANSGGSMSYLFNFGQAPFTTGAAWRSAAGGYFSMTPPAGCKALCTTNFATSSVMDPSKQVDVKTWTGNGTSQNITGVKFKPDFAWIKNRSTTDSHQIYDVIRGAQQSISSDSLNAETTVSGLTAFNADGITVGSSTGANGNTNNIAGIFFRGGGTSVANNNGSITSQVSVNYGAGVSIVSYTGIGANATIGHGLSSAPKMIITKRRNGSWEWAVWHAGIAATEYLFLNSTAAKTTGASLWNSTTPTSTVFSVGTASQSGAADNFIAYCFAEIPGFSSFGSYTGNGNANGAMIYCGFRPRLIIIKKISAVGDWMWVDTARDSGLANGLDNKLYPGLNLAENTNTGETTATNIVEYYSTGFKLRTTGTNTNAAATYIYAAFADSSIGGGCFAPNRAF